MGILLLALPLLLVGLLTGCSGTTEDITEGGRTRDYVFTIFVYDGSTQITAQTPNTSTSARIENPNTGEVYDQSNGVWNGSSGDRIILRFKRDRKSPGRLTVFYRGRSKVWNYSELGGGESPVERTIEARF